MPLPDIHALRAVLHDPKRWRRWGIEAALMLALVVGITLWQNRGLPEGPAPALAGQRTGGGAYKLGAGEAAAAGQTAQLVVFWATWCPVCRAEEGNIEDVALNWPVVSVAMQSGNAATVTKYLKERELAVPAVIDDEGTIAAAWHVRGTPTHFILDPAGNIRFRVVGYATEWGLRFRLWWAASFPIMTTD